MTRIVGLRRRLAPMVTGLLLVSGLGGCGVIGGSSDDGFCDLLEEAYPAYRTEPLEALGADAEASEWRAYFDVTRQRDQKLVAVAPAELSTPMATLQRADEQIAAFFADAGYNSATVDAGALTQLLRDAGYREAVTTVGGYARDTCRIDIGPAS